jgi:hydroxyquinol 1,2-dioxygenase
MRDFNETTITAAVIERFEGSPNPRVRELSAALVRHLHDFIREVEPTFEEWERGIKFLTDVGAKCTPSRQEVVLLSDTLGVSMLIDAINHRLPQGASETTVLGPFFVANAPELALGSNISAGMPGEPLFVDVRILDSAGRPLPGAIVDVWHSDKDGYYDVQRYDAGGGVSLRAHFRADAEGRVFFWSIVPSFYPVPTDGPVGDMLRAQGRHPFRPAHVHFMIAAPGFETLVTHVFIAGDPYLDSDAVFGVKNSLVRKLERREAGAAPDGSLREQPFAVMSYDFRLAQNLKPR